MTTHYADDAVTIYHGDCLDVLASLSDYSIDAVVTDPPYGLGFMGKQWDALPPGVEWAAECLRVLKPGGHLLAFGGSRTWHRLAVAVEDAGFELRDSIAWLYASGFPKSLDVSKAIDKVAGARREVAGSGPFAARRPRADHGKQGLTYADDAYVRPAEHELTAPATEAAQQWQGWGTALKPAFEPIVVARKPLAGTVAANVQQHGTGALNIDACRVGDDTSRADRYHGKVASGQSEGYRLHNRTEPWQAPTGRWPTNVVLDESQAAELDQQTSVSSSAVRRPTGRDTRGIQHASTPVIRFHDTEPRGVADSGGASRFFPTFRYEAKAPASQRPKGEDGSAHPTVKPLDLMRWLVRLVTPPGGVVLEPFAGSGTTVEACLLEGFRCIAIEREAAYLPLILQRLARAVPADPGLFEETA